MSPSGASTSSELSEEEKQGAGIGPGLVRMSIGISGTLDQRWAQLHEAVTQVQMERGGLLGSSGMGKPGEVGSRIGVDRPGARAAQPQ